MALQRKIDDLEGDMKDNNNSTVSGTVQFHPVAGRQLHYAVSGFGLPDICCNYYRLLQIHA